MLAGPHVSFNLLQRFPLRFGDQEKCKEPSRYRDHSKQPERAGLSQSFRKRKKSQRYD
jgi:hypothetical protein